MFRAVLSAPPKLIDCSEGVISAPPIILLNCSEAVLSAPANIIHCLGAVLSAPHIRTHFGQPCKEENTLTWVNAFGK